ncbi:dTDP-4-dehydrorhamnose 3,5-epimerase [Shewanella xiamenensis]|uniref:dTDP-4-dehydrorhamnose 3,5-epimerase n=1 Tax=Shewanella xiamenensis TaxID=332186 RepID=UPI001185E13D|nr:dTDP-4-dehydrorhamnose 3,5-epimerase [Shewanella xiamenensis]TVL22526.1 dTDP-4-dehydrorhamnose 3,5-epimerase [Shewanella xiamenensis]TVL24629.1 dTDP-4-dehydrorhamnose 3,5-epimerase [Shewanella xiamenensis]TVL24808.1 dTDP-4-dehydrorhamnose 3,5-epimerase [Shewanella xiamenensis]TVL38616.1 dTDP-4-dehydrorhamnose 3,5-epimerase [Shewanella xiamenensis]TVP05755.1 dTDP-4-dehydrorhamnose 3,5-epimerase [Shewanella xiamenensis]
MKIIDTSIPAVKLLEPTVYGDERGYFMETYRESWFRNHVADVQFVQDNHSRSAKGILRGLHFQLNQPQGKLVRVVSGEVFDVAVDLRRSSPTFGKWVGFYLSAANKRQLWIPAGFAHGFYVTSENTEFVYKCTEYYDPSDEYSLLWNDPEVSIEWPLSTEIQPILSVKDANGKNFLSLKFFE